METSLKARLYGNWFKGGVYYRAVIRNDKGNLTNGRQNNLEIGGKNEAENWIPNLPNQHEDDYDGDEVDENKYIIVVEGHPLLRHDYYEYDEIIETTPSAIVSSQKSPQFTKDWRNVIYHEVDVPLKELRPTTMCIETEGGEAGSLCQWAINKRRLNSESPEFNPDLLKEMFWCVYNTYHQDKNFIPLKTAQAIQRYLSYDENFLLEIIHKDLSSFRETKHIELLDWLRSTAISFLPNNHHQIFRDFVTKEEGYFYSRFAAAWRLDIEQDMDIMEPILNRTEEEKYSRDGEDVITNIIRNSATMQQEKKQIV